LCTMRRWFTKSADASIRAGLVLAWVLLPLPASAARTAEIRSSDGAPVEKAALVFAVEQHPGPYEVSWSDGNGRAELPQDFAGVFLVIHPAFLPQEVGVPREAGGAKKSLDTVHVTLRAGDALDLPERLRGQNLAM